MAAPGSSSGLQPPPPRSQQSQGPKSQPSPIIAQPKGGVAYIDPSQWNKITVQNEAYTELLRYAGTHYKRGRDVEQLELFARKQLGKQIPIPITGEKKLIYLTQAVVDKAFQFLKGLIAQGKISQQPASQQANSGASSTFKPLNPGGGAANTKPGGGGGPSASPADAARMTTGVGSSSSSSSSSSSLSGENAGNKAPQQLKPQSSFSQQPKQLPSNNSQPGGNSAAAEALEKKTNDVFTRLRRKAEGSLHDADKMATTLQHVARDAAKCASWGHTTQSMMKGIQKYSIWRNNYVKELHNKQMAKNKNYGRPGKEQQKKGKKPASNKRPAMDYDDDSRPPLKKTKEEIEAKKKQKERRKRLDAKKEELNQKFDLDVLEAEKEMKEFFKLQEEDQKRKNKDTGAAPAGAATAAAAAVAPASTMNTGAKQNASQPKKKKLTKEERAEMKRLKKEQEEREEREYNERMEEKRREFQNLSEEEKQAHFEKIKRKRIADICKEMDDQMTTLLKKKSGQYKDDDMEVVDQNSNIEDIDFEKLEKEKEEALAKIDIDPEARRKKYMGLIHIIQEEITIKNMPKLKQPLMEHQVEALQWLLSIYNNTTGGLLADEMGLGKTATVISFLGYLKEQKYNHGPFLIVVPKTVLQNWQDEFKKFYPDSDLGKNVLDHKGNISKHLATHSLVVYQGNADQRETLDDIILERIEEIEKEKEEVKDPKMRKKSLLILTNYEQVSTNKNFALLAPEYEVVVVDEAQRMKNQKSQFSICMAEKVNCKKKILLTGTPLQNKISELYALLNFILPDLFDNVGEFSHWFSAPFREEMDALEQNVSFTDEEEAMLTKNLHAMLAPFMLKRMKSEIFSDETLAPYKESIVRISLSHWQRKLYKQLQEKTLQIEEVKQKAEEEMLKDEFEENYEHKKEHLEEKKTAQHEMANIMMQMRKCVLHPFLFSDANANEKLNLVRTSGKFEMLERVVTKLSDNTLNKDHKILLFSQFTSCLDLIEMFFEKVMRNKIGYRRIDGSNSAKERQDLITEFTNDKSLKVMLLSAKAASVGINLQVADTVIIFDQDWNPQNDRQAIGRAHRVGQKREVRVLRFITTSAVEEIMEQRCREKLEMEKKIIGAGGFNKGLKDGKKDEKDEADKPLSNHAAVVKMIQEAKEAALKGATASKYDDSSHVSKFPPTTVSQLNLILSRDEEERKLYEQIDTTKFFKNNTPASTSTSTANDVTTHEQVLAMEKELDALSNVDRMVKVMDLTNENMERLVKSDRLMGVKEVPDVLKVVEESEDEEDEVEEESSSSSDDENGSSPEESPGESGGASQEE